MHNSKFGTPSLSGLGMLAAVAASATFIQTASAATVLSNWFSSPSQLNALTYNGVMVAVKFTVGSASDWNLTSIKASIEGSGSTMTAQIWTDGSTSATDPTASGATTVGNAVSVPYDWAHMFTYSTTFNFGGAGIALSAGKSYWAVFTGGGYIPCTSSVSLTDNGSGWSLGQTIRKDGSFPSGTVVSGSLGVEFNATQGAAPAPGAAALLGIAGLAGGRRRRA